MIGQNEGLPNITGSFVPWAYKNGLDPTGAFSQSKENVKAYKEVVFYEGSQINFDASRSNSIYGASNHVTTVNLTIKYWKRTA